ncbi:MAG: immunoglobulin-like domain-containing protein [Acutalibacteraceae bacterium]
MKKVFFLCVLLLPILLCSCKSTNNNENTFSGTTSTNESLSSYASASDTSSELQNSIITSSREEDTADITSREPSSVDEEVSEEFDLVIETDRPYYYTEDTKITFTLYNTDRKPFTYKTDFFLQIEKDGEWKYYPTKSGLINYEYKTEETDSHYIYLTLNLEEEYNLPLQEGTYRIIQESDEDILTSNTFTISYRDNDNMN